MHNHGIGSWVWRKRERSRGGIALAYRDERIRYKELAERIDDQIQPSGLKGATT